MRVCYLTRAHACTQDGEGSSSGVEGQEASKPAQPYLTAMGHDHLAAFIDYCVVGRVYDRGSGERNLFRVPTFPKFEVRC